MRISEILVHRVNIRLEAPYQWVPGWSHGHTKGIVEVHTDEGIVGFGEVATLDDAEYLERRMAQQLAGLDPLDLDGCFTSSVPEHRTLSNLVDDKALRVFGGVELALWDIRGKQLGAPLHVLLGGPARTEVRFSEYFSFRRGRERSADEVAAYCAEMRAKHRSTIFEGKVGFGSPDVEIAQAVRDAIGPDATLRLDANMGWTFAEAERVLPDLEVLDIANVEEPVADLDALARLRSRTRIPFSAHAPVLRHAARTGAPDRIVLSLTRLGGIRETVKFIHACELMGVGFWFYSGDSGVATAAYLQVSAALPYLEQAHQSLLRWYVDDVIAGGPFRPENDVVQVPQGPGLGVELDPDGLARCADDFARNGELAQLDPGEEAFPRLRRQ
jgi:glucarate dehydratase